MVTALTLRCRPHHHRTKRQHANALLRLMASSRHRAPLERPAGAAWVAKEKRPCAVDSDISLHRVGRLFLRTI